jgi:ATP-dependent DNA helicase RecQ
MLVDVAMPNRSLTDLTERFNIDRGQFHRALPDAVATASVIRELLNSIDMNDPSWPLAIAVLETFDNPLVSLMPELSSPPELSGLHREPDPLLVPSGAPATDAWSATRDAFPVLQAQRGLRPRAAQQEMAHAVAEVFDRGGRLAVEAPTGTGKSLAYLLPGLGRASRPGQPVVVATATKALQSQLRDEASQLQAGGLLRAPFRQVQGVGNYVCARELEDALPDDNSSGLALGVAIRALASSPTGDLGRRHGRRHTDQGHTLRTHASASSN